MEPTIIEGWLKVPYDGSDFDKVFVSVDKGVTWIPAYFDYRGTRRVVQVRPPDGANARTLVMLKVGTYVYEAGRIV